MSQLSGKRNPKVVKRTRRPTRTIKRKSKTATESGKFIRSPLMDMPPHVQMDTDNPISAYLADYYMNTDIEKLSRKMFGAAIDEVYNKHKIVIGRAQPTALSSASSRTSSRTASSTSTSTVGKTTAVPRARKSVKDIFEEIRGKNNKKEWDMGDSIERYSSDKNKKKKNMGSNIHNFGDIVYNVFWRRGPFKITSILKEYDTTTLSDLNVLEKEYKFDVLDMETNEESKILYSYLLTEAEILDWYNIVWLPTSSSTVEKARSAPLTSSDETTSQQEEFNIKRDGLVPITDTTIRLRNGTYVYCNTLDGTHVYTVKENSTLRLAIILDNNILLSENLYKIQVLTGPNKNEIIYSVDPDKLYIKPKDHPGYNEKDKNKITNPEKVLKTGDIVYVHVSDETADRNILRKAKVIGELDALVNDNTYNLKILDGPKKGNPVTVGVTNLYQ